MKKPTPAESMHDHYWRSTPEQFTDLENLPRIRIALDWVKVMRPKKVLDIGCGPGHLAAQIRKSLPNARIDGVDFSKLAIEKAKRSLNRFWKLNMDFEHIPTESNHYDAIICLEVLEHVYNISHIVEEISRLLKRDGKALISVPNLAYWRYRVQLLLGIMPHPEVFNPQHIRAFTLSSLRKRLLEANLQIDHYWGYGKRLSRFATKFPSIFSSTLFMESSKLKK